MSDNADYVKFRPGSTARNTLFSVLAQQYERTERQCSLCRIHVASKPTSDIASTAQVALGLFLGFGTAVCLRHALADQVYGMGVLNP